MTDLDLSPEFPFLHHFDEPTAEQTTAHSIRVRGWAIFPDGARVEGPLIEHGARTPLTTVPRHDVERTFTTDGVVGFDGLVGVEDTATFDLVVVVDGVEHRVAVPVELDPEGHRRYVSDKAEKLRRVESLLRCPRPRGRDANGPSCGGRLLRRSGALRCTRCRTSYPCSASGFDFLSPELRTLGAIDSTEHISDHVYDETATDLVEANRDGLVLDYGAGLRREYRPNVVNFDVVDYPTTDVTGIGERLPFADESFDAVLSIVVLEHVRDPFRCAAEIRRIVRPGGKVYVTVPFLQPYHGFPNHYYNMTRQGLEQLFAEGFEIERSVVPNYGQPISTLTWFLQAWLDGLPEATAEQMAEMRVKDLVGWDLGYLQDDFVRELEPETVVRLACVNTLLVRKC